MDTTTPMLPLPPAPTTHRWFSAIGCVVVDGDRRHVFLGGSLIGSFDHADHTARNAVILALCTDPHVHLGRVARAFEIAPETLRLMRRQYESEGLLAVLARAPGGSESKITEALRLRVEQMFERGLSVRETSAKLKGKSKLSRGSVGNIHKAWALRRPEHQASDAEASGQAPPSAASTGAPSQDDAPSAEAFSAEATRANERSPSEEPTRSEVFAVEGARTAREASAAPSSTHDRDSEIQLPGSGGSEEESRSAQVEIAATPVLSGRFVQHLGAWLLVAFVARMGLHRSAAAIGEGRVASNALRIALDAVVIAFAIGERCVEGVRRLATPTAGVLLRADHAPSATWVRRALGCFSLLFGGARLMLDMAVGYLGRARADAEDRLRPIVFYVDNHMRPYTGDAVVRKGWRMQDKRARPGATDFYVHDEAGRPVLRFTVPSNDALRAWLLPVAKLLRDAVGADERMLLAFDRGGAFANELAELRDQSVDFVTYERRPFPELSPGKFDGTIEDDDGMIGVCDTRTNLGDGRGRLRRIALRMPDQRQVNLLAVSSLEPAELYRIMRGRWSQENGFKYGVERWGINQLDARTTKPYPPETVIPNPARRRLDRAMRIARVREGAARRELARRAKGDPKHADWQRELEEVLGELRDLQALRAETPTHAPLSETELAGALVRHEEEYKTTLDTIRIACANAESELAALLAEHLRKPAEAKRALANLLAAPGSALVGDETIVVTLKPAGTPNELEASRRLLRTVNGWRLTLPGDPSRRGLVFRSPS